MSLQALFPAVGSSLPTSSGTLSAVADFEVLARALDAAGLSATVGGLSDFTLFAPTDAAFADLAVTLGFSGDTDDPDAVFGAIAGALSGLSSDGDPIPLLTDILLYHVSGAESDAAGLNADGPVATLLTDASVEVTGNTVVDGDPNFQNADIISPDVDAGMGTIQVIDQVLLPLDTPAESDPGTLLDVLKESGGSFDDDNSDFDMLLAALQATGLDAAADDPDADLTVFAPNDAAFVSLAQSLGYEGEDEEGAFQAIVDAAGVLRPEDPLSFVSDVLTYHISPGEQDSTAVLGADSIDTLLGSELGVDGASLVDADPDAADAEIIATDVAASNGVAHVIDEVLRPLDLPMLEEEPEEDPEVTSEETSEDDDGFGWVEGLGFAGIFLSLIFLV
ncbi:MAG: fasciclin domain-containing protein [Shimia sp.]|uniref:fasciclin domain-containing protein n=1 Tax=Shimia sp. TaxID=1954381 RepID=UPI001B062A2B|nr:fasciclin domain-containing protein [Shimia sp.]MBO6898202.1 fasciclin domain-containing protein [Shimia sp.]